MSRRLSTLLTATLVVALAGLVCAPAFGQAEDAPRERPQRPRAERPREAGPQADRPARGEEGPAARERRGGFMLLRGIELTEEQREQIRTIQREARQANRTWRQEHGDEIDAAEAEVEKARAALEAAMQKLHTLLAQSPGSPQQVNEQIMGVLTEEQKAQYQANLEAARQRRAEQDGPPRGIGDRPGPPAADEAGPPRFRRDGRGDADSEGPPPRRRPRQQQDDPAPQPET